MQKQKLLLRALFSFPCVVNDTEVILFEVWSIQLICNPKLLKNVFQKPVHTNF